VSVGGTSIGYGCNIATKQGLTLAALAQAKKLPAEFLRTLGVKDFRYSGGPAVRIPYADTEGNVVAVRFRLSLTGQRFKWRRGDHTILYGLHWLEEARRGGWVLLVEGESDSWTGWHHGISALGIPGKSTWRREWAAHLNGLVVYLWQEPEAEDLTAQVATDIPGLLVIAAPKGIKDLSDAHVLGVAVPALLTELRAQAVPAQRLLRDRADCRLQELSLQAAPALEADDPLSLVETAIRSLGYGGDLKPPQITYLSLTSRLLAMRHGAMPVHLALVGPSCSGKSYTLQTALKFIPPEAYHVIDAGSPRVLIYDGASLKHRAAIFSEADSLPAGEDNPAASAVRNLAQDHHLHYSVTVRNPEAGDYAVREVCKEGPTVLITTAVHALGGQLGTRLFTLDLPDDTEQIGNALLKQAALELDGAAEPDPALVAYQAYLQAKAPFDVVVPFVTQLAEAIRRSTVAPRILRDFQRLLALIKAVTILRHRRRRIAGDGRLVAEIDDYAAVYGLVREMYQATITGASGGVRKVVGAVRDLTDGEVEGPLTHSVVARRLRVDRSTAQRNAEKAIKNGWLINKETRPNHRADLALGEPLAEPTGLPEPEAVCCNVAAITDGCTTDTSAEELEEVVL
jgi:hypothetical protein